MSIVLQKLCQPRNLYYGIFHQRATFQNKRRITMAGEKRSSTPVEADSKKPKHEDGPAGAGYKLNINLGMDKEHEAKSFKTIAKLPPGALQGLKAGKADDMLAAFHIGSIEDLGKWKYYKLAKCIQVLASLEEEGQRSPENMMNINHGLIKAYETTSFTALLDAPPSALSGLAEWTDGALKDLGIKTIGDLATWKYATWAEAITEAAAFETEDFSSI